MRLRIKKMIFFVMIGLMLSQAGVNYISATDNIVGERVYGNITSKIEEDFNNQLNTLEKLNKYTESWKKYFNLHNFDGMQKEYLKIKEKLKMLIPMENTLKQARTIENLHILIKNNGQDFNLTEEQLKLS